MKPTTAAMRRDAHAALASLEQAHREADRAQLFRTAEQLSRIKSEFIRFKDLGEGRPQTARRLVGRIERADACLEEEHEDVGIANRYEQRSRRGLITVCALFGLQLANMASQILEPEAFGWVPDFLKGSVHQTLALVITALAAFPVRDFVFAYRFGKAKELASSALAGVKKEVLSGIGSERLASEGLKKKEGPS